MAGVKGAGGPVPKRSDQRRRKNPPAMGEPTKAAGAKAVPIPRADPKWHPLAMRWYGSLAKSGQSHFYEPSDWATAAVIAESMSRELSPQGIVYKGEVVSYHTMTVKAGALAAWLKGMAVLMVTEGDRRRLAMELTRPKSDEVVPDVTRIDDYRRRLEPG